MQVIILAKACTGGRHTYFTSAIFTVKMKLVGWFLCFPFFLSDLNLQPVVGVIRGKPAGGYPFFVLLFIADEMFGASIFGLESIVTAAHCLYCHDKQRRALASEIYVVQGDFSKPIDGVLIHYQCERYVTHENYDPTENDGVGPFDIAIILVERKFNLNHHSQKIMLCWPKDHVLAVI